MLLFHLNSKEASKFPNTLKHVKSDEPNFISSRTSSLRKAISIKASLIETNRLQVHIGYIASTETKAI